MRAVVVQFLRTHRLPLIAVAVACVHSLLFWSLGPRVPLGLFIAAVMVCAWQGGLRPAFFATALSVPLLAVLGYYQAPGPGGDLLLRLGLFVLVGLIAGYLSQQCRQAIRAVDHVHEILGGSGIALISADAEGHVTSLNPLARTLTGLDSSAEGKPLAEVFRVIHGPDRQPVPSPPPGAAQELPEGALLLRADGGETAVEGSAGPVRDADGRPSGVMVVFREAGGRNEAWQELSRRADRFRALAGYAPAGLMVLDAEGRCVFSNPAAQAACGCTADEALGEGWSRHVRQQDRDRLIGDWLRAVVARQPFADEFLLATGPGVGRWLRVRSAPMLADGGEVLGHVAALEEVSERRRAEEALADARRESEEQLQEWAAAEQKAAEALRAARAEAEEAARKAQAQLDERGTALRRAEEALAAARADAEDAARKAQGQLDERGTALRRAEEALAVARADAETKLREAAAGRKKVEEQLSRVRAELEKANADAANERRQAEEEVGRLCEEIAGLKARPVPVAEDHGARKAALCDAWREEVAAVATMHTDARARLEEALAGHRGSHERLQSALAEKDGTAEALRNELARLAQESGATREAHDRLQALLAERGGSEESLRKELERLGDDAAALRQSHDRLQSMLSEKGAIEGSLRQEVDRLQAALSEKAKAEEALRQESERLRSEAADERRRAAEAQAALRGDNEFLEGVIDGSPAGIFAHDREGRCRVWNAALERLLSRPRADALGRTAAELFPPVEGRADDQGERPAENGAARPLPWPGALGLSDVFESSHAPVRDAAGAVVGGMTMVRLLPQPTPQAPAQPGAHENGAHRLAAMRLGDIDWLAFN